MDWAKIDQFNKAVEKYEQHFGEKSFDRVVLIDVPAGMRSITDEEYDEAIKQLREAIKKNEPIEQIPQEILDKMRF